MLSRAADRAWRLTSRLLASAPVFGAVQEGLSFTLTARRKVDRALEAAWSAINVVSYRDIEELRAQLAAANATIAALEARLARLATRASGSDTGGSGDGAEPR